MGDATLGVLLLLTALLFALPKTRPLWWLVWHRLRKLLALAVIIGTLVGLVGHGT